MTRAEIVAWGKRLDDYIRGKRAGSPLVGFGEVFVRESAKNTLRYSLSVEATRPEQDAVFEHGPHTFARTTHLDFRLPVSIAGAETSFATAGPGPAVHNAWGYFDPRTGTNMEFPDWPAGIARICNALASNYVALGFDSIEKIGSKWCPVGAANDPLGINVNWVPVVTTFYLELGGVEYVSRPVAKGYPKGARGRSSEGRSRLD
jgi:hypothetical protein